MEEKDFAFSKSKYDITTFSIGIYNNGIKEFCNAYDNELYDLASITKLFTLKLLYDLQTEKKLNLYDCVKDCLNMPKLKDTTILDLIKMKDIIRTSKKLSDTQNKIEFLEILLNAQIIQKDVPEYNDIGFCLLGVLIEKVTNQSLAKNFEHLFQKLGLKNTYINPDDSYKIYGNGNNNRLPHDKKTRIAGGITGASGIFSNVFDMLRIGELLIEEKFFDKGFLMDIFKYNFIDHKGRNRTYAGLYKYTDDYKCYIPKKYTKKSLAHQGYTGATLIVDLENKIVNVLLFDAILKDTNEKSKNFFEGYDQLQEIIANRTLHLKEDKNL